MISRADKMTKLITERLQDKYKDVRREEITKSLIKKSKTDNNEKVNQAREFIKEQKKNLKDMDLRKFKIKKAIKDDIVYVGYKPFMNYVTDAIMKIEANQRVVIIGRGKFLSKTFNVSEVTANRFFKQQNVEISKIDTYIEEFKTETEDINMPIIEITLIKKQILIN